ncbi:hypothetical protein NDU88_005368 [Pleurodeles waltl]|uniref:Uncharacterized protein n=1 Tax=Pleurodeles waltl TaxID=8319 RepID=A0AAV7M9T1_PLEWA|nr:hypothetical protein NDU88_005368 [Pleurodeles waltl]
MASSPNLEHIIADRRTAPQVVAAELGPPLDATDNEKEPHISSSDKDTVQKATAPVGCAVLLVGPSPTQNNERWNNYHFQEPPGSMELDRTPPEHNAAQALSAFHSPVHLQGVTPGKPRATILSPLTMASSPNLEHIIADRRTAPQVVAAELGPPLDATDNEKEPHISSSDKDTVQSQDYLRAFPSPPLVTMQAADTII